MTEPNGGFSFGAPMQPDGDSDQVDAIEVDSEPVSRSEAKNMGISAYDTSREAKAATSFIRLDQLPSDVSGDLANKLERAWNYLKRNETEEALTLAQEVVFEYPSLVAAKIIIARCFINRKEHEKALAILQAIAENDMNAETLYYIGLCQSRLGRVKEAIDSLKLSRAALPDPLVRKRVGDLLMHLQGEQTVCPMCGKKTLYDSMVDVGNQTVCTNCARNLPENGEEGEEEDEHRTGGQEENEEYGDRKKRRRLRPPLSRTDILMRLALGVLLLFVLGLGVFAVSILMPERYGQLRSMLPASWTFLPEGPPPPQVVAPIRLPEPPKIMPSLTFDSPHLSGAVAGIAIDHLPHIDGMEDKDGDYTVSFNPKPAGPYQMNAKTGAFTWTPAASDGGKAFEIVFGAVFRNVRALDQVNTVRVSAGPKFKNLATVSKIGPGQVVHLFVGDLSGDAHPEFIVATGEAWGGEIIVFGESGDGFFKENARVRLAGRPAGIGVINSDDEKWLAVADYWNSRLRHYALRNGKLAEMAVNIDLPGRPLLAGFDRNSSTSAVLCRLRDGLKVFSYRQEGQLNSARVGEWSLPSGPVWRRILMLPMADRGTGVIPVVVGGDSLSGVFLLAPNRPEPIPVKIPVAGTVVDAAIGPDGRFHCLVAQDKEMKAVAFAINSNGEISNVSVVDAGNSPAMSGVAALPMLGEGNQADMVFLSSRQMGLVLSDFNGKLSGTGRWDLPRPARLLGQVVSIAGSKRHGPRVVFMDTAGDVWSTSFTEGE